MPPVGGGRLLSYMIGTGVGQRATCALRLGELLVRSGGLGLQSSVKLGANRTLMSVDTFVRRNLARVGEVGDGMSLGYAVE
jgi:hypothetical protein